MPKSKAVISDDSDYSDNDVVKPKKPKVVASKDKETKFDLSSKRFVSVSEFKGKKYINIREYYEADGELKPGKKGIALSQDQWKKLISHIDDIDEQLHD